MKFMTRKRRQPPAIIIISLIDILIVLLIFLMVTTTFKQQPALKLSLPESSQPKEGALENSLLITLDKKEPYLYFGTRAVTLDKLTEELKALAAKNPEVTVSIRPDKDAPVGQLVKVMDAIRAANIKNVIKLQIKSPGQP